MRGWLDRRALSWALYDFGNTIFSMNVVTLYFPLYLVKNLGLRELHLSIAIALSMAIGAAISPLFGALSDRHLKKNALLAATTMLCCIATALIPLFPRFYLPLAFFVAANFFYQISLIVYDALLPSATESVHFGALSGFGVALGYGGTFLALILGMAIVSTDADNALIFAPTAAAFFLFALPCFWVKERKPENMGPVNVRETARRILADRNLLYYFIGHVLYLDAVNTIIAFMAVFLVKIGGFSQEGGEVNRFFMFSTAFAVCGGLFWGALARRKGAHAGLVATLALWCVVLALVLLPLEKHHYWLLGPLTGIALGGVWACDRPLLLDLVPHDEAGRFFGFYYLTGKLSSIIGPLIFGLILSLPGISAQTGYRLAFLSLLIMMACGFYCIARVRTARTKTPADEG